MDYISKGILTSYGYGGIFDFSNEDNPFKDWSFIYLPYCTGDLFWEATDQTYETSSDTTTIRLRGHVNFQVALEWLKENYTVSPEKIFVTGISAGSYGAILNFPYIKQEFPEAEFYMLGDGGVGAVNTDFLNNGLPKWNVQIPDSTNLGSEDFTYFDGISLEELDLTKIYAAIAEYYHTTVFAQYTTAWDYHQTYYYNVMSNIDSTSDWVNVDDVRCEWNSIMDSNLTLLEASADTNNFKFEYFVAPGTAHTILMNSAFFTESSNGTSLLDWKNSLLDNNGAIESVYCVDCEKPSDVPNCD